MNNVYHLLPSFIPDELCDRIYIFSGIRTPSCVAFKPFNDSIHADEKFLTTDTIWTKRVRDNPPITINNRDIDIAFHTAMIEYLSNSENNTSNYVRSKNRSNILFHKVCIEYSNAPTSKKNNQTIKPIAYVGGDGLRL
jgi:hypothetical protein